MLLNIVRLFFFTTRYTLVVFCTCMFSTVHLDSTVCVYGYQKPSCVRRTTKNLSPCSCTCTVNFVKAQKGLVLYVVRFIIHIIYIPHHILTILCCLGLDAIRVGAWDTIPRFYKFTLSCLSFYVLHWQSLTIHVQMYVQMILNLLWFPLIYTCIC